MKVFNWTAMVGVVILVGIVALFTLNFPPSNETPSLDAARAVEQPRAERMAAKAAYFHRLYKDPQTNQVPLWSPLQKQQIVKKYKEQLELRGHQNNLVWEDAGPNNVGGRTRAIALDRRDSKVVLTGGVRGGIWKSVDDGATWKHIPGLIANESIMSIAQDPIALDHWYAVTGELVAAGANFFGGGVYRSIDNGESWELQQYQLGTNETVSIHEYERVEENNLGAHAFLFCGEPCDLNPFVYSSKVVVSPTTQTVFVATNGYGVKRSTNSTESFQHSVPQPLDLPVDVAVEPIQLDAATTLLLPFDESLTDLNGNSLTGSVNIDYTEGVHSAGAIIGNTSQFDFPKEGIIDGRQGTVEFWFKPNWDSFNTSEHDFILVGNFPDAIFIHHIESQVEIIHTAGDQAGQEWARVGGSTTHWQKGEWVHLAFSWGGNEITYYENGLLVGKQALTYTLPDVSGTNIQFGREQGGSMDGTIDELRVSSLKRTADEVLRNYLTGGVGKRPNADPIQRPLWSDVDVDKDGRLLSFLSGQTADGAGVYFSNDDGSSWTNITPEDWDLNMSRGLIRFAPSNPNVAYLFFQEAGIDFGGESFFKIDVAQQSLEDRSQNLPKFVGFPSPEDDGFPLVISQWTTQMDVKPDDENFVIVGGVRLARSFDGFATNADDLIKHHINANSHVDNHLVVFDPDQPNMAWLGNDGGIFKTDNILRESPIPFANIQWQHKFKGYNVVTYYALGLPRDPGDFRIIGGTQDRGTPVLDRANVIDPQASIGDPFGGDGGFSFLGKNHAYVYAAVGQSYRLRYNDAGLPSFDAGFLGLTGTLVNREHGFINPFVVDLEDETAMYYPIGNKLLRYTKLDERPDFSDLQASDWEEPAGLAGPSGSRITALELSTSPKDILYYAVQQDGELPQVYRLEDAENATVPQSKNPIMGASPGSWVRCIAVNPDNADEIVAVITSSNVPKLFHSLDRGSTFTNVDGNLANTEDLPGPHTNWLSIMPYDGTIYYVLATTTGVFATQELDGPNTVWELQDPDQIGFASAQMVQTRPADGLMAVATYGRGIFIGGPNGVPTAVDEVWAAEETPFNIFPNPTLDGLAQLQFELPKTENLSFRVNDMAGREIWRKAPQKFDAGAHRFDLQLPALNNGVYVVRMEAGGVQFARKLLVTKN